MAARPPLREVSPRRRSRQPPETPGPPRDPTCRALAPGSAREFSAIRVPDSPHPVVTIHSTKQICSPASPSCRRANEFSRRRSGPDISRQPTQYCAIAPAEQSFGPARLRNPWPKERCPSPPSMRQSTWPRAAKKAFQNRPCGCYAVSTFPRTIAPASREHHAPPHALGTPLHS